MLTDAENNQFQLAIARIVDEYGKTSGGCDDTFDDDWFHSASGYLIDAPDQERVLCERLVFAIRGVGKFQMTPGTRKTWGLSCYVNARAFLHQYHHGRINKVCCSVRAPGKVQSCHCGRVLIDDRRSS
ncbi:MAG: hypothetical protein GY906_38940 [bacterium]|nr:hypothetical protein [bacterium]